ncbi:hypothetical protein O23A_p1953 [Aeromonas salmonicida]|nr:hypothetical protein O23A_p1953 [Aeromonas salmonicida]
MQPAMPREQAFHGGQPQWNILRHPRASLPGSKICSPY